MFLRCIGLAHWVLRWYEGTPHVVEILLNRGANPDHGDILEDAVFLGFNEIVRQLVDAGASVTEEAMFHAVEHGNVSTIEELLCNASENNIHLNQCLDLALEEQRYDLAQLLIVYGATLMSSQTRSVLRIASQPAWSEEPSKSVLQHLVHSLGPNSETSKHALLDCILRAKSGAAEALFESGTRLEFSFVVVNDNYYKTIWEEQTVQRLLRWTDESFDVKALFLRTLQFGYEPASRLLFTHGAGFGVLGEDELDGFYGREDSRKRIVRFLASFAKTDPDCEGLDFNALLAEAHRLKMAQIAETLLNAALNLHNPWMLIRSSIKFQAQPELVALILKHIDGTVSDWEDSFVYALLAAARCANVDIFRLLVDKAGGRNPHRQTASP